ncbi:MAG TPA: hypothetical protein VKB93_24725 [Thermoanaerobaculia bacterium]|nr:hypothetical protein [Thermoanaerobaculia bacterium]
MRRLLLPVILVLFAASAPGQEPQKRAPWSLTLEERIALRTDAAAARKRVLEGETPRTRVLRETRPDLAPIADSFTGKNHPELFFPFQVFQHLMLLAFDGNGAHGIRQEFMRDVQRLGLPADFWLRLEASSAAFRADDAAVRALLRRRSDPEEDRRRLQELDLRQSDYCRDRADALAAARAEFGAERFDRFLYEVIAYRMFHVSDTLPKPDIIRWAAGGCR